MIILTSVSKLKNYPRYKEKYLITRGLKAITGINRLEILAPSKELFSDYLENKEWLDDENIGKDKKQEWYLKFAKEYLRTILSDNKASLTLKDLVYRSNQGEVIILACGCENKELCHRNAIASFLKYQKIEYILE